MNSAKGIYLYTICKRFLTCMIIKKILLCGARLADDAGIVTADSDSPGNVFLCMNLQMSSSELAESRTFCRWWFAFLLQNRWRLRALINRYRTSSYTLSDGDIVTMNYYNAWVYNYICIYIYHILFWLAGGAEYSCSCSVWNVRSYDPRSRRILPKELPEQHSTLSKNGILHL